MTQTEVDEVEPLTIGTYTLHSYTCVMANTRSENRGRTSSDRIANISKFSKPSASTTPTARISSAAEGRTSRRNKTIIVSSTLTMNSNLYGSSSAVGGVGGNTAHNTLPVRNTAESGVDYPENLFIPALHFDNDAFPGNESSMMEFRHFPRDPLNGKVYLPAPLPFNIRELPECAQSCGVLPQLDLVRTHELSMTGPHHFHAETSTGNVPIPKEPDIFETKRLSLPNNTEPENLIPGEWYVGPSFKPLDGPLAEAIARERWRAISRKNSV